MLDFFRDRISARTMLNLIEHLPAHSHYAEAIAQDDELAPSVADDAPQRKYRPRISEWSPTEQLLAAVFNRLGELIVVTAGGGNMPEPWPTPETAAERAAKVQKEAEWNDLFDAIEQARARGGAQ